MARAVAFARVGGGTAAGQKSLIPSPVFESVTNVAKNDGFAESVTGAGFQ